VGTLQRDWVLCLLLVASVGATLFTEGSLGTFIISPLSNSSPPFALTGQAWIVFTNASGTYAKNPEGLIKFSDYDADKVLSAVFSGSDNLSVVIDEGMYFLTSTIHVPANTSVYAKKGAEFYFLGNAYLNLTGNNIIIESLCIKGDGMKGAFGIRAQGNDITVRNCTVERIGKAGFFGFGITQRHFGFTGRT